MGLKAYHDSFIEEQVNGEILSECDDEMLLKDLKVASKLHRVKLMKIITGEKTTRLAANSSPILKLG